MMGVPSLQYHCVALPAFPGLELPAAYDPAEQRLYFPVATVCSALEVDVRSQRARLQRDFAEHIIRMRLPTAGGVQELLCVEYEALALWLATIQAGKASERFRRRLREFRTQVMAAATDILMGRLQPVPLEDQRRGRASGRDTLLLQVEGRVAQLERAVFVGEPGEDDTDMGMTRHGRCPHCGGTIKVSVGTLQIAPDGE